MTTVSDIAMNSRAAAGNANINLTATQQLIRGFGASSAWCGALSDAKMDTLFKDMGL